MTLKMYSFSVYVTIVWMNTKQSLCTLVILMSVSKSVTFITTVFTEQDSEREWDNHSSRVSVFVLKGNKTLKHAVCASIKLGHYTDTEQQIPAWKTLKTAGFVGLCGRDWKPN